MMNADQAKPKILLATDQGGSIRIRQNFRGLIYRDIQDKQDQIKTKYRSSWLKSKAINPKLLGLKP
jgi:hypothetical protein